MGNREFIGRMKLESGQEQLWVANHSIMHYLSSWILGLCCVEHSCDFLGFLHLVLKNLFHI